MRSADAGSLECTNAAASVTLVTATQEAATLLCVYSTLLTALTKKLTRCEKNNVIALNLRFVYLISNKGFFVFRGPHFDQ